MSIQLLNDLLRTTMLPNYGLVVLTNGMKNHPAKEQVITQVRQFTDFNEGNDPYGEHDFGSFVIDHETFYWKIDYYDKTLEYGSEDPADPNQTTRVLTIMLASEY